MRRLNIRDLQPEHWLISDAGKSVAASTKEAAKFYIRWMI